MLCISNILKTKFGVKLDNENCYQLQINCGLLTQQQLQPRSVSERLWLIRKLFWFHLKSLLIDMRRWKSVAEESLGRCFMSKTGTQEKVLLRNTSGWKTKFKDTALKAYANFATLAFKVVNNFF